jgi:hypothetical protein
MWITVILIRHMDTMVIRTPGTDNYGYSYPVSFSFGYYGGHPRGALPRRGYPAGVTTAAVTTVAGDIITNSAEHRLWLAGNSRGSRQLARSELAHFLLVPRLASQ